MFRFLCKLSLKMIMDWKKEMILVMVGIVISSCAVIKFTDNISHFERYYWDVKGIKEEQIFYENRVHFSFNDSDKLTEIVEQLKNQEGIINVILKGTFEILPYKNFPVAAYSAIPVFSEHDNSIGEVPENVKDGTIVLSFASLMNLELIYIYDEDFSESQKTQAANLVQSIKPWENVYEEEPDNTLGVSEYLEFISDLVIGMVLAVLNALFIYQAVLKRRMPSYSVLKLLGLKNFRLGVMILFEMLMVFLVSYSVAIVLFLLYCNITGELLYNLRYSIGYSFSLLLIIYIVLSVVLARKLMKSQPFEAYIMNR